jgi:16S rRNA (cytidine1402-2'-O)-methyltransferase
VACNLTLESESIVSKPVSEWRSRALPDLHKQPAIFLLLA